MIEILLGVRSVVIPVGCLTVNEELQGQMAQLIGLVDEACQNHLDKLKPSARD